MSEDTDPTDPLGIRRGRYEEFQASLDVQERQVALAEAFAHLVDGRFSGPATDPALVEMRKHLWEAQIWFTEYMTRTGFMQLVDTPPEEL